MVVRGKGPARHLGGPRAGRPTPHPEVSAFPLDDELVLFDGRTGEAHVLNRTGAHIWGLCDGTRTVAQVARGTASRFGVSFRQALGDTRELLGELAHADLIARG